MLSNQLMEDGCSSSDNGYWPKSETYIFHMFIVVIDRCAIVHYLRVGCSIVWFAFVPSV